MPKQRELTEVEKKYKKIAVRLGLFFGLLIFFHFLLISLFFSFSDWVTILIFSLLLIGPGYIANGSMVFKGGGKPIDGGKMWRDGRRIFGGHKTWSGLIKGPLYIGIPISIGIFIVLFLLWPFIRFGYQLAIAADVYVIYDKLEYYQYYFIGGILPIGFLSLIIRIILCSYGAGIGDLIGSFIKRRFDIKSGAPFWIIDQLDFVSISLLFLIIPAIFLPSLFWMPDIHIIIFLLILTPSISILGNNFAYFAGWKEVPW